MQKRITIAGIARHCHLSAMTVSRVLRQSAHVDEKTRAAVLRAAEALGYSRSTRQGRPAALPGHIPVAQIIVGSFGSSPPLYHLRLLVAVEQRLSVKGYDCMVRFTNGNFEIFARVLEAVRRTATEVTVGLGNFPEQQLAALQNIRPGILLLDTPGIDGHDALYNSIVFDNAAAAQLAVHHLLSIGRRRILLLTGPRDYLFAREVEDGYRDELASQGLPVDPALIVRCDFSPRDAGNALEKILADGIRFDAIFTNDEMAAAVYRVLPLHHLSIPRDVAVCGCDNIPSSEQFHPELTTVSLPCEVLADEAARLLSQPPMGRSFRLRLRPELIQRQSTSGGAAAGNVSPRRKPLAKPMTAALNKKVLRG